jgi:hypothetical protein
MATFKTMDDIDREKHKESREKMRVEVSEDVNNIIGNVFGRPKPKRRSSFWSILFFILKVIGGLFLLVLLADIVLGSVWLLKFFLKGLFGIG